MNLGDVCRKISLNNIKIKQKDYLPQGSFPIVDQGSELIGGYSNETKFIVPEEPPYVIFGDHTKVKKYINFKFIAGADGIKVLKPLSELDSKFLFYCLHILKIPDKGYARHFQFLEKENFPIPPLFEQQQIVSKIEELFSELDKGKQQLEAVRLQLKTYRQAVLKWAFEGRLTNKEIKEGQMPEGWKWVKVFDIGIIETGSTPSKKNSAYYSNDFPFYKPTDLDAGSNVRSSSDNLSKLGIKEARFLSENSVLITCIGATIGKSGIIRKAGASNQQINAIIPFKQFNPNFIYYQAIAPRFQNSLKKNASSTTLPILNKTKFMNLEMISCPIKEQNFIVQEIETRLSVCDKIEGTINNSLQQSGSLRQSILKQAFEGKLIKSDENFG